MLQPVEQPARHLLEHQVDVALAFRRPLERRLRRGRPVGPRQVSRIAVGCQFRNVNLVLQPAEQPARHLLEHQSTSRPRHGVRLSAA